MQFDVLTLFPEMFEPLNKSIIGRAKEKGLININLINIRDFSKNKHKKVDDTPYGGGAGMVMMPDVVYDAYKSLNSKDAKVIYMSPQGQKLNQKKVVELSKEKHIILLCGHYEDDSTKEESFSEGLLEYPQYTRPEVFNGKQVPEVLLSGHHENIDKWRREQSLINTKKKRPDLLENIELSEKDKRILEK